MNHQDTKQASGCPFHKLRSDLPTLTQRIAKLPVDERGYPVPFFVAWVDGKPEFRAADGKKWMLCARNGLCWCCGQTLGAHKAFLLGPMCVITRTTAEPANHLDCALWSAKGCPFLSRPKMERREHEKISAMASSGAGIMIERNPGVVCVWMSKSFKIFPDGNGKPLITVGEPEGVSWFCEGRPATRAEVMHSIETGLPLLKEHCRGKNDLADLEARVRNAMKYLPKL